MIVSITHEKSKFSTGERKSIEGTEKVENEDNLIESGTTENPTEVSPTQSLNMKKESSKRLFQLTVATLSTRTSKEGENVSDNERNRNPYESNSTSPLRGPALIERAFASESPPGKQSAVSASYLVPNSPLRRSTERRNSVRGIANRPSSSIGRKDSGISYDRQGSQDNAQRNSNVWDLSMGPKIVWTLKKELKSKEDAEVLNSLFISWYIYETIKNFPFFSRFVTQNLGDLEEGAILQLCKHMKYEKADADQYIFKEGDLSNDKLYIILSGKVHIILQNDRNVFFRENVNHEQAAASKTSTWFQRKRDTNKQTNTMIKSGDSAFFDANSKSDRGLFLTDFDLEQDLGIAQPKLARKKSKKLSMARPGNILSLSNKELNEGEAFGEKALTSKDSKRSASIYASVDCQFIILMKEDYLSIVGKYHKENRFKLHFLQSNLPYVDRITSTLILEDFLYIFNTEFYKRGNTIIEQGKPGLKVYMLVEGECTIEKKIMQEKSDTTKTVFIAKVSAPAILGEEILYQKRRARAYKYTIKADSLDVKLYYCEVNALMYRFPKETVQKLKEHYDEKETIREERLNFVLNLDNQSISQRDNPEIKSGYKQIAKMAARGCRSSFYERSRSSISTRQIANPSEKPNDEMETGKQIIDNYSRAFSSIRKKVMFKVQGSLEDHYKSAQFENFSSKNAFKKQEMLLSGGLTDRPKYATELAGTEKNTRGSFLLESVETIQNMSQLPSTIENQIKENEQEIQVDTKQKLPGGEKSLQESFKELIREEQEEKAARLGHRKTKSNSEPFSQAKLLLLGPKKKITPESLFNKRHYIIRKSYGSENPIELKIQPKIAETATEKSPLFEIQSSTAFSPSLQAVAVFRDPKLGAPKKPSEKVQSPQQKREELKDTASNTFKRRLLALASQKENPQSFSKMNVFSYVGSNNKAQVNEDLDKSPIRSSFGLGKLNRSSMAVSKTLTTAETPRSVTHRPNPPKNRQKALAFDEFKTTDKSLTQRSAERPSPLITEHLEEDKLYLTPRYDVPRALSSRIGGKATSVKNLMEKSKQLKALHSTRRVKEGLRKASSIYDQQSQQVTKDSRDL